jgi:hypothetical protein
MHSFAGLHDNVQLPLGKVLLRPDASVNIELSERL